MMYDLKRPCGDCPFKREGGIRLDGERIESLTAQLLDWSGPTFACHKSTGVGGEFPDKEERHCAGALIFSEKHGIATQMTRIAGRLGMYSSTELEDRDAVFDTAEEMLETALDNQ